jgi:hypothetical protein
VTLIDTDIQTLYDASASPLQIDWTRGAAAPVCYQHGVRLNGAPYLVGGASGHTGVVLLDTDPLLAAYRLMDETGDTIYNVLNLVQGDDGWDPLGQRDRIAELESQLGVSLTGLPVALQVAAARTRLEATADTTALTATLLRWGGYPVQGTFTQATRMDWKAPSQLAVRPTSYLTALATTRNRFDSELPSLITATSDYGPQGAVEVRVAPYLTPAPTLAAAPRITMNKKGKRYEVQYTYTPAESRTDAATVTWYRCTTLAEAEALCADPTHPHEAAPEALAVRRARGTEGAGYTPSKGDLNAYLVAVVTPQVQGSESGAPRAALFGPVAKGKLLSWTLFDEQKVSTDFHDLPTWAQPRIVRGAWTFDAYKPLDTQQYSWTPDPARAWYYGAAQDAAVGQGLVQWTRGARLFYTPVRESCRVMRVTAIVDPCKSGGQGFGSATGQYMELYVGYDPTTLTGYGLRIERTPEYDKAVVFTLMRYDHGVATPLCAPQASSCYRTSCTLRLTLGGGTLKATAETSAEAVPERTGVSPTVLLEAAAGSPEGCAMGLQHTGTTGAGATLIHYLEGAWE